MMGIDHLGITLEEDTSEDQVIGHIQQLNEDRTVSGILVQLPLPPHLSEENVINAVRPDKDIDGLHPQNMGCLAIKHTPFFISCTALGCVELMLSEYDNEQKTVRMPSQRKPEYLRGKNICIIGKSNIVGLPLSLIL